MITTAAIQIDRSELMAHAWKLARQEHWSRRLGPGELRGLFPQALRDAWVAARTLLAIRIERAKAAARPSAEIAAEITLLDNTDRLGFHGMNRLADLRAAHRDALAREAEEAAAAELARKRDLIAASAGRICAVTFTKKDGTERVMKVQPAKLKFHVKGDAASDAGRKASATRAARHPNLLPVWDAEAQAPRSVNLATVSRIAVNGRVHDFTA